MQGGDGTDTVDYSIRGNAKLLGAPSFKLGAHTLSVSLDGQPDDGSADIDNDISNGIQSEGDNAGADIENVIGGPGADHIVGNDKDNILIGCRGDDTLDPGSTGDDTLAGGAGSVLLDGIYHGCDGIFSPSGNQPSGGPVLPNCGTASLIGPDYGGASI